MNLRDIIRKVILEKIENKEPTKYGVGYKVFQLRSDGLYPMKIANEGARPFELNKWIYATAGKFDSFTSKGIPHVKSAGKGTKSGSGTLSWRPGFHIGMIPSAAQFNKKTGDFPASDLVWAEVLYSNDVNYQDLAMANGVSEKGKFSRSMAGYKGIPRNGSYLYKTNADQKGTDPWVICGAMKIVSLLTPSKVDEILQQAGRKPLRWSQDSLTNEEVIEAAHSLGLKVDESSNEWSTVGIDEYEPMIDKYTQGSKYYSQNKKWEWGNDEDENYNHLRDTEYDDLYRGLGLMSGDNEITDLPPEEQQRIRDEYQRRRAEAMAANPVVRKRKKVAESIAKTKKVYLRESQVRMLKEIQDREVVFFEFFRDVKHFLKDLLTDPIHAESDGVLKNDFGLDTKHLKKILLDRHIVTKKESFSEDYDDVKGKDISHYHIAYQVPRGNFQNKIMTLYQDLMTSKSIKESCDGYIGNEHGVEYYHMNDGFGNLNEDDSIVDDFSVQEPIEKEPHVEETQQPQPNGIKVLCACEESQAVCKAFRAMGFDAYSCDIQEASGGQPDWHIMGDALEALNSQDWDVVIAFPPCTHLASSGALYWKQKQKDGRQKAARDFFMKFVDYPCRFKCIENPAGIMSTLYRKPDQYINPSQFGDPWNKRTGLWLYGLPKLVPTKEVEATNGSWVMNNHGSKTRSKTFPGIAGAMAQQWGTYILDKLGKR